MAKQHSPQEVTELLIAWSRGDLGALNQLMPLVYDELRKLASRHLADERPGHTLQSAALVHETYLKLVNEREISWQNRAHFFAVAAQFMRKILIDYARGRSAAKRGGGAHRVSLDEALEVSDERAADLIALDDALNAIAMLDERKGRIAELRYFGGLIVGVTANA